VTASTERRSPLGNHAALLAQASGDPARFAMRERAFVTQLNLRGDASDAGFASAVRGVLGGDLPAAANTWTGTPERGLLWLGPDEWLVVAPDAERSTLEGALRTALAGRHHSLVDVSANRTVIELSGTDVRAALAKGCSLPLHAAAFAPPQCAQTVLAKSQVLLQACETTPVFRLYVRNSFAHYLAQWLADAAAESAASKGLDSDRIAARLR
jgi:sarcosine oxidase subunit gamma